MEVGVTREGKLGATAALGMLGWSGLHGFLRICSLGLLIEIVHCVCLNEILQYFNNSHWKEQNAMNTVPVLCTSYEPWFPSLPGVPHPVLPCLLSLPLTYSALMMYVTVMVMVVTVTMIVTVMMMTAVPRSFHTAYQWADPPDLLHFQSRTTCALF